MCPCAENSFKSVNMPLLKTLKGVLTIMINDFKIYINL